MKLQPLAAIATAAFCIAATTQACATGGQRVLSHAGTCEMTVPADWKANGLVKSAVSSPDRSIRAVISTAPDFHAMSEVKPIVESAMAPVKVFEDTPRRLWYQYEAPNGGTAWYVGVPGKDGICGSQITFKNATQADTAKQVALSVKPAS